jgi:post-segregation antitoxin (ccd killing protein)
MGSRLINVRLDEDRLRKARRLREHGIAISDVVREAIDERFRQSASLRRSRDVRAIVTSLFERYPDPPGIPARSYDVHDGKQARAAIRRRLRRRRR